jgi:hypothetical protein
VSRFRKRSDENINDNKTITSVIIPYMIFPPKIAYGVHGILLRPSIVPRSTSLAKLVVSTSILAKKITTHIDADIIKGSNMIRVLHEKLLTIIDDNVKAMIESNS